MNMIGRPRTARPTQVLKTATTPSDGSDMESDQDQGSGHHSDLDSEQGSDLGSAPGSDAGLGSDNGGDPESSDNGGDFLDMFTVKKECPGSSKRPKSGPSSDKLDLKKKKSDRKETPSKNHSQEGVRSGQSNPVHRGEVVHKFREEEEN